MASPLEAKLILCDSAQADPTGKVHMLGAGWSILKGPSPTAVAVLIKVPWDRANEVIPLQLVLQDGDGNPIEIDTPNGPAKIENRGTIEVGRPPGIKPGSALNAAFALNVPPLPLKPGRYEWRLELAELSLSEPFTVQG